MIHKGRKYVFISIVPPDNIYHQWHTLKPDYLTKEKKKTFKALMCSVHQFSWHKHSHQSWFQVTKPSVGKKCTQWLGSQCKPPCTSGYNCWFNEYQASLPICPPATILTSFKNTIFYYICIRHPFNRILSPMKGGTLPVWSLYWPSTVASSMPRVITSKICAKCISCQYS